MVEGRGVIIIPPVSASIYMYINKYYIVKSSHSLSTLHKAFMGQKIIYTIKLLACILQSSLASFAAKKINIVDCSFDKLPPPPNTGLGIKCPLLVALSLSLPLQYQSRILLLTCLPPCIHYSTPAVTNHIVIPLPCLVI